MRNLTIIIVILVFIGIFCFWQLIPEFKKINWPGSTANLNKNSISQQQPADNINLDEDLNNNVNENDEEVEDVGDLQFYSLELGRSDVDIQSKRTYEFYLPSDIVYELQGVDASSSILIFKKDNQAIFTLNSYDYAKPEEQIEEFWPEASEYSLIGGHTNILQLDNDDYEDEMYIFADTLEIDGELAF